MLPSEGEYGGAVRASTATGIRRLGVVVRPPLRGGRASHAIEGGGWTKGRRCGRAAAAAEVVARAPAVVATAVARRRRQGSVARAAALGGRLCLVDMPAVQS